MVSVFVYIVITVTSEWLAYSLVLTYIQDQLLYISNEMFTCKSELTYMCYIIQLNEPTFVVQTFDLLKSSFKSAVFSFQDFELMTDRCYLRMHARSSVG